jgi:hypothetical protein
MLNFRGAAKLKIKTEFLISSLMYQMESLQSYFAKRSRGSFPAASGH